MSPESTRNPPPTALAENTAGLQSLQRGDFAAAARRFEAAIASDPDAPGLWVNLASARRGLGDDAAEREALEAALALDQRNVVALVRLGELHERRGDRVAAAARWRAVLVLLQQPGDLPEALVPILSHARAFVAEVDAAFAEAVDDGLREARAKADETALRRFDVCVAAATGRREIFVNHCDGVHYPFLPADEFFERRHFPWLSALEAMTGPIKAELEALLASGGNGMKPYVSIAPGTPRNKWSALSDKLDWSAFFLWKFGVRQDENCERCPTTARLLDQLPLADMPGKGPTAFFSILRPHTRLPAHTGVTNLRAIIHLPLIVPPGCGFRVGGETREWKVGEAFAFDDTIDHEAWNDSDELRALLILDSWNPHLSETERELVRAFFRTTDASGFNPAGDSVAA